VEVCSLPVDDDQEIGDCEIGFVAPAEAPVYEIAVNQACDCTQSRHLPNLVFWSFSKPKDQFRGVWNNALIGRRLKYQKLQAAKPSSTDPGQRSNFGICNHQVMTMSGPAIFCAIRPHALSANSAHVITGRVAVKRTTNAREFQSGNRLFPVQQRLCGTTGAVEGDPRLYRSSQPRSLVGRRL